MERLAHGKLNLALGISGRRADGYHLIDTVMQEISLADTLHIEKTDGLEVDCPGVPVGRDTVSRAAHLFFSLACIREGARIRVEKRIPMGSGLGGGSSDAACALLCLNEMHGRPLSKTQLMEAATQIGADVPFFIDGGTQRATGIGEKLEPIESRCRFQYLLAMPAIGVSTKEAYALYDRMLTPIVDMQKVVDALQSADAAAYFKSAGNALLPAAERLSPQIGTIGCACMDLGAAYWGLTGSGSCVFAVFDEPEARQNAYRALSGACPFVAKAEPASPLSQEGARA